MKKLLVKIGLLIFIVISIVGINFLPSFAISNEAEVLIVDDTRETEKINEPKYGQDSAKCVMELSLYREFFRQKNIPDAITHWKWVFNNCPLATQNTYIDGVKIIKYQISKDKANKLKYVDTLMMIYDQRIKYFPTNYKTKKNQVGYILGRKGVDLIKLNPDKYEEAYKIFKESVDLENNNSKSAVLVYYFRSTINLVEKGKADKSLIVETYVQISDIIDYNIANNIKYSDDFIKVQENIEQTFEPYASCEDLISIYSQKFNEKPEDVELLRKVTKILDKNDCIDNKLFFDATEMLHQLDPTPKSAFMMGKMAMKKNMLDKANKYLSESAKLMDGDAQADSYLLLASILYKQKDFPGARTYAFKAAQIRPGDGRPYLLIGDIYSASAKSCGSNDLTSRVAYWAAVDKYVKAKSIDNDATIKEDALRKISIYSKQFPGSETIFFYNLKIGDPYKVECWINENTIVRAAK